MASEAGALDAEVDPLFAQRAEQLVVGELSADLGKVLVAHKLGARAGSPRVVELMIRAMLCGRLRLAAAAWGAADVELAGDRTGAQGPELSQGAFDLRDAVINLLEGTHAGPW